MVSGSLKHATPILSARRCQALVESSFVRSRHIAAENQDRPVTFSNKMDMTSMPIGWVDTEGDVHGATFVSKRVMILPTRQIEQIAGLHLDLHEAACPWPFHDARARAS